MYDRCSVCGSSDGLGPVDRRKIMCMDKHVRGQRASGRHGVVGRAGCRSAGRADFHPEWPGHKTESGAKRKVEKWQKQGQPNGRHGSGAAGGKTLPHSASVKGDRVPHTHQQMRQAPPVLTLPMSGIQVSQGIGPASQSDRPPLSTEVWEASGPGTGIQDPNIRTQVGAEIRLI